LGFISRNSENFLLHARTTVEKYRTSLKKFVETCAEAKSVAEQEARWNQGYGFLTTVVSRRFQRAARNLEAVGSREVISNFVQSMDETGCANSYATRVTVSAAISSSRTRV